MTGHISSWKLGDDEITDCQGNVFPFDLDGVSDVELAQALQQIGSFSDPGPCPGRVPVRFATQGGFAVGIGRLKAQISWQEF